MPIKQPTRVGGEFLDLRSLVAAGPVLVLFRITSFLRGELDSYGRTTYPVTCDALICSGPREGEVHLGETLKYAPANALRGLTAKASDAGEQPVNAPGDELPYLVQMIDKKGSQPFVGLDPAEGEALAQILRVHDDGRGWTAAQPAAQASQVPAQQTATPPAPPAAEPAPPAAAPAEAREPAMSGAPVAPSGGPRPWET